MREYVNLSDEAKGLLDGTKGRALWFHLLLEGAENMGVDIEKLCDYAIYRNGKEAFQGKPGKNALEASHCFAATPVLTELFGAERVLETEDHAVIHFHSCPLYKAWKDYGLSPERIHTLCDMSCKGDYGRASNFPVTLTFKKRLGIGDEYCVLDFVTKK